MFEIIFLIALALIWIIFASVQDLKSREVANWISFSLIIFALGFRFFYSLFNNNFSFFYQGLIGLGIFFAVGNLLYYGRMFAGGDAKLMIALGAVLPFFNSLLQNLQFFALFLFLFLFAGAIYGMAWSAILTINNFPRFRKEFSKRLKQNKKIAYAIMMLGLIFMGIGLPENLIFYFGIIIFILPYFYLYAKAVDEVCMVKRINSAELREGDWLYKDVGVGRGKIKASWDGLSSDEIRLISKKHRGVLIREGIAFVPVFLLSFAGLVWLWGRGIISIPGILI